MKQLSAIKCLTVFMLIFLMGNFAYGDTASSPDPLKLIAESKYYGKMTKDQAAEIIKTCTSNTYKTRSIVDKDNFLMDVPKETLAHPLVTRTKQIFKWTEVKHIQLLKKSIKLTYVTTFLGINSHGTLELDPQGYNLSDLALAAMTLSGLPLNQEKAAPAAYVGTTMKTDLNLEENLSRLKGSYNQGKMSEAVYESKQKEIIGSMLKECFDKGLISKTVFESMQKKLPDSIPAK